MSDSSYQSFAKRIRLRRAQKKPKQSGGLAWKRSQNRLVRIARRRADRLERTVKHLDRALVDERKSRRRLTSRSTNQARTITRWQRLASKRNGKLVGKVAELKRKLADTMEQLRDTRHRLWLASGCPPRRPNPASKRQRGTRLRLVAENIVLRRKQLTQTRELKRARFYVEQGWLTTTRLTNELRLSQRFVATLEQALAKERQRASDLERTAEIERLNAEHWRRLVTRGGQEFRTKIAALEAEYEQKYLALAGQLGPLIARLSAFLHLP